MLDSKPVCTCQSPFNMKVTSCARCVIGSPPDHERLACVLQMKDRAEMTYEERLEAAERHRLKGNVLFQEASPGMLPLHT